MTKIVPKPKKQKPKIKERLFVANMTRIGTDTFNNATWSFIRAYRPDIEFLSQEPIPTTVDGKPHFEKSPFQRAYDICRTEASKLFAKPHIKDAVNSRLLEMFGDDDKADLRHAQLMFQDADLGVSLSAIRDRNKLKKRVGADEPPVPLGAQPITHVQIVMPGAAGGKPKVTQHSS